MNSKKVGLSYKIDGFIGYLPVHVKLFGLKQNILQKFLVTCREVDY